MSSCRDFSSNSFNGVKQVPQYQIHFLASDMQEYRHVPMHFSSFTLYTVKYSSICFNYAVIDLSSGSNL